MALSPMAWQAWIHSEALRHGTLITREPCSGAVFEPPAVIAGLDDVAMMGQTVEQLPVVILASPNTLGAFANAKLVVTTTDVCS